MSPTPIAELAGVSDTERTARFQCLMVYMRHGQDPTPRIFQGTWEGRILHEARGDNGFGYDPIFYYPPFKKTFAELPREQKSRVSHRGKALRELKDEFDKVSIWIRQHMPRQEKLNCHEER